MAQSRLKTSLRAFRHRNYRLFFAGQLTSLVGTWMQTVAGAWLMTTLTPNALPVALMQTATTLPSLVLGLPAGSLADRVDRRRLLLLCQVWMLACAALLSVLTVLGLVNPWLLLGLTFGLGDGRSTEDALALGARCGAACMTGRGPYEGQLKFAGAPKP